MSSEMLHEVGISLEKWFEEMERGARRPDPREAELFASEAFRRARPGIEQ
jgi:hypothetical protein